LFSGLKVNFDKTKVVWIGKNKFSSDSIKTRWKLIWNQQTFDMLGLTFHVDLDKMIDLNYTNKLSRVKALLKSWSRRILTPIGRIQVIKTIVLPVLTHLLVSLPNPPHKILVELNDLFLNFVWNGSSKISKNVLIKEYSEGGLKMIDIFSFIIALKCSWMRRLITGNGKWINIIKMTIDTQKLYNCGVQPNIL